jgi:hypothetical protein
MDDSLYGSRFAIIASSHTALTVWLRVWGSSENSVTAATSRGDWKPGDRQYVPHTPPTLIQFGICS